MKKLLTLSLVLVFCLATPSLAIIQTDLKNKAIEKTGQIENGVVQDYTAFKAGLLKRIDLAISRLNKTEDSINSSSGITSTSKNEIISLLEKTEQSLNNYKTKVEATESLEDLQNINQEITNYLKQNKDVIKTSINNSLKVIAQEAVKTVDKIEQQVTLMLKSLEKTCPSEIENIKALEAKLTQLENEALKLKNMAQGNDSAAIKNQIKVVNQLGQECINLAFQIEEACLPE